MNACNINATMVRNELCRLLGTMHADEVRVTLHGSLASDECFMRVEWRVVDAHQANAHIVRVFFATRDFALSLNEFSVRYLEPVVATLKDLKAQAVEDLPINPVHDAREAA